MTDSTVSAETAETELAAEIVSGLRCLAVMIEANPDLAHDVAYTLGRSILAIPLEDEHARLARWARAGKASGAVVAKDASGEQFEVNVTFGPVRVRVIAPREQVCERIVIGTDKVTKKVKDPAALAAVPEIEVTEEVEQIEWKCRPLLASEQVPAGTAVV